MKKLNLSFKNCYEIKRLEKEFDFSERSTYAVYAPNGVMKTSFAKAFMDLSNKKQSSDQMFPHRETIREIKDENNVAIRAENVFVVEAYNEAYDSEKISTLLVNKELKEEYDGIYKNIETAKSELLKELRSVTGFRDLLKIEEEISEAFTYERGRIFESFDRIEKEVLNDTESALADIKYSEIFNEKVLSFLSVEDIGQKIQEYLDEYNKLIDSSTYFKRGVFNHNNADVIAKSLMDNGFFEASHSVSLNSKGIKKEINSREELVQVINKEKQSILSNPELIKAFEAIDNKLKVNNEMRHFREYLLEHLEIVPQIVNLGSFKQKLWVAYLQRQKDLFVNLQKEFRSGKQRVEEIVQKARDEETKWRKVVDIFNERFSVPFVVKVKNQEDVILKSERPSLSFIFKDVDEEREVEREDLIRVLSSGEKKALYVLNIVFEIEARKENQLESLLIVDDIADSFDYKNKYAIIEYLRDITQYENFFQIILTHNFDFFRTIESRFLDRDLCNMVVKTEKGIEIKPAEYLKPFSHFMRNLNRDDVLIASIPFVRNIVEYTRGPEHEYYKKLTSLLHIKKDTHEITIDNLEEIYREVLCREEITLQGKDRKVIELVYGLATAISKDTTESINLENKIVLSVAIRLKAEEFMIAKINNPDKVGGIEKNQTVELFNLYKETCTDGNGYLSLLGQVNLMTPENIHFNSFMYEPILDMSDKHLKQLYTKVNNC